MDHSHHESSSKSWFKTYLPLILVLSGILLIILLWQYQTGIFDMKDGMRLFMGLFFLCFGFFKLLDWKGFVHAYQGYDIIAKRSKVYAYLYPLIELALGSMYLMQWYPWETYLATAILMGISSIGVIQAVSNKRKIQCACLGTVVKLPMTTVTIIEDLGMGLMAVIMLWWM